MTDDLADGGELEVTVLLPCLNEAETLAGCVCSARSSLAALGIRGEVLVSDNGSTDGSPEIARAAGARVIHAPVPGYGGALSHGVTHARGEYVIMADADDSYDLAHLGPFLARLREGHDIVMGNRFRGGISPGAMPFLHRYLGNPVLSWVGRTLFGLKEVGDFHCGIRGFRRDRVRDLDLCLPGMEYASEMVVRAQLAGHSIVEVPTTLRPDGRSRPPHLRTWRDGWRHLRFLLVLAPRTTLLVPGLTLFGLGLAVTLALVSGPKQVGSIVFDVNTLIYGCFAMLVGAQVTMFGGFAQLYGEREGIRPDTRVGGWLRRLNLENCMAVGLLLVLAGAAGSFWATAHWGAGGFGPLEPQVLRIVLPSATAIALGVTVGFAGLLISLLSLRRAAGGTEGARAGATAASAPGRERAAV